jgi:hypothetical protein
MTYDPDPSDKPCETRTPLLREWRDALVMYANTSMARAEKIGKVPQSEYRELQDVLDIAWELITKLRTELDGHVSEHQLSSVSVIQWHDY